MPQRSSRFATAAVRLAGLALVLLAVAPVAAQAPYEQVVTLQPGWNAMYLQVRADNPEIGSIFSPAHCGVPAVPLLSVWTYDERFGGVGTIVDPVQGLFTTTGWFGFFPADRPEAVLNNLFAMQPNRAYLVKLGGTQPITCTIPGTPVLRFIDWVANSFNLVGLRIDPTNPPTFQSYFSPSEAHAGQPIFRLDPSGTWQPVLPFVETARDGEAYWVYSSGPSDFQGPLEVEIETGDLIDFGASYSQSTLEIRNLLDVDASVSLRRLPSSTPFPLHYRGFQTATGTISWPDLPDGFSLPVDAEDEALLTIGPDRAGFSGRAQQVLEVTSEFGARVLVTLGAETTGTTDTSTGRPNRPFRTVTGSGGTSFLDRNGGGSEVPAVAPPNAFTGLWVGDASVDLVSEILCVIEPRDCECRAPGNCDVDGVPCATDTECGLVDDVCAAGACTASGAACTADADCPGVSQVCVDALVDPGDAFACDPECPSNEVCSCSSRVCANPTIPDAPQPTGREFNLRLMVHVDRQGDARLLKEVIQLFKQPQFGPDPATPGFETVIDPGNYVLITDDDLIPEFTGVAMRDGKPVGLRISTAAYDFDDTTPGWNAEDHVLPMVGTFDATGGVATVIETGKNHPTNPFRHKFHPDHNNLDSQFLPMTDVCSDAEYACSSDEDCSVPLPSGPICLPGGEPCDPVTATCYCVEPTTFVCENSLGACNQANETVDCQEQACEVNDADCAADTDCLEFDLLAADAICAGDPTVDCVSSGDCGADGPCVPKQACELDRAIACMDDAACVAPDATANANTSACDGNLLRLCGVDADCAGVDAEGVPFDDGVCVTVRDDGPCTPLTDYGPCGPRYDDVATENPCVGAADLGECLERAESPSIRRTISLTFASSLDSFCTQGCDGPNDPDPPLPAGCSCESPEWGSDEIGGTFRDTVQGLHRVDIVAEGEFTLRRVSEIPVLNREP